MVKKFFYVIVIFFTVFVSVSFFGTLYLYEKEKEVAKQTAYIHQYNYYLNDIKDNTLELIKKTIENEYKSLKNTYKKNN